MLYTVLTAELHGIESYIVEAEILLSTQGLPTFTIVGLPETTVKEAHLRVTTAIRSSGYTLPVTKIIVNLAPAHIKKSGTTYDLALAVGILGHVLKLPHTALENALFLGELSFSGLVKPLSGALTLAIQAKKHGIKTLYLPQQNAHDITIIEDITIYPVNSLSQLIDHLLGKKKIQALSPSNLQQNIPTYTKFDFSDVKGQETAKRAIEIAAAGHHNLLFIGPPGCGKTMLAKRIPSILPPLPIQDALDVTQLYSAMNLLDNNTILTTPPFRSPHHTISKAGLLGGGRVPKAGEVSLAHCGVLFLDELLEFQRSTLDALRQPLESHVITITRNNTSITYPARCIFVAATNPCPCGYRTHPSRSCICSDYDYKRYKTRLSGPLIDRIEIHVELQPIDYQELTLSTPTRSSSVMREAVTKARQKQEERYYHTTYKTNAFIPNHDLQKYCSLGKDEENFLIQASQTLQLSARSYTKIIKVARTIADLDDAKNITISHLAEAIGYRVLERSYW